MPEQSLPSSNDVSARLEALVPAHLTVRQLLLQNKDRILKKREEGVTWGQIAAALRTNPIVTARVGLELFGSRRASPRSSGKRKGKIEKPKAAVSEAAPQASADAAQPPTPPPPAPPPPPSPAAPAPTPEPPAPPLTAPNTAPGSASQIVARPDERGLKKAEAGKGKPPIAKSDY